MPSNLVRGGCVLVVFAAMLTASAQAATVTVSLYNLGEDDPGAFAGGVATDPTVDAAGPNDATRFNAPEYEINPHATQNGLAMSFENAAGASGGASSDFFSRTAIPIGPTEWGVEAWVKSRDTADIRQIFYNGNSANAGMGLLQLGGNYVGLAGSVAVIGGAPIQHGVWTHLALVNTGGATTLYVNGVASGAPAGNPFPVAGNLNIGARQDGNEAFEGVLDSARVFTVSGGTFNPGADLMLSSPVYAHYTMGEDDAGAVAGAIVNATTTDDTGARPAARVGSQTYSSDTPGVFSDLSVRFTGGTGDYLAAASAVPVVDKFSLTAYAKAASADGLSVIAYNGNTGPSGFGLFRVGGNWQVLYGGVVLTNFVAPVEIGEWTHLELRRYAGVAQFLVDGELVGTLFDTPNLPAGNLMIGGNPLQAGETFDGWIDEVRLVAIPEPTSATLLAIGLLGVARRRRRTHV